MPVTSHGRQRVNSLSVLQGRVRALEHQVSASHNPSCVSFFAWRTVMSVPSHGRSASLNKELSHCQSSKTSAKTATEGVRPISGESWSHQEPCNKSYESWWIFRGLLCQTAVQEQMCVPFAEASKSVLSMTSERSDCPPKTRRVAFLQCDPEARWSVSKTTHLLIKICSPLCFHKYEPRGLATQKRESLN